MGTKYPDQYLLVEHNRSGLQELIPIGADVPLDLEKLFQQYLDETSGFCLRIDGDRTCTSGGEYYAAIKTDGNAPHDVTVWDSAGFFVTFDEY